MHATQCMKNVKHYVNNKSFSFSLIVTVHLLFPWLCPLLLTVGTQNFKTIVGPIDNINTPSYNFGPKYLRVLSSNQHRMNYIHDCFIFCLSNSSLLRCVKLIFFKIHFSKLNIDPKCRDQ